MLLGRSKTGKSFASKRLASVLKTKCIHYDVIIELVCECTRLYFENHIDEKPQVSQRKVFENDTDFQNFKEDVFSLISSHKDLFNEIYDKFIKNTLSRGYLREKNLDISNYLLELVKVVPASVFLEELAYQITTIMIKNIIKNEKLVIIEGVYFQNKNYLKSLQKHFDDVKIINCSCVLAIGIELYYYNNEEFTRLIDLENKIISDFSNFLK